jgi:hypothetical protein
VIRLAPIAAAAALLCAGGAAADSAELPSPTAADKLWRFEVLLDDRTIGQHEFRVRRSGDVEQVDIEARFEVSLLFITAYEYEHSNTERWEDGCLASIRSSTDDNGELYSVQGRDEGDRFELQRNTEPLVFATECVRTFAYWDRSFLAADQLLNSQTGELEPVEVRYAGRDTVDFAGRPVQSDRYALETADGDIHLWYAAEGGQWLALEAPARGDRVIRYRPLSVPGLEAAEDDRRLALQ